MSGSVSISACIICKNAESSIGLALDSLAWCDETVVVDSGSTDRTLEICTHHPSGKVRLMHQSWLGFTQQRKFAAQQCRHDWVLMLDADEECSAELRADIEARRPTAGGDSTAIFEMPRKNYIARRHVRCWGPDYQTRLIHRQRAEWGEASIPELRWPKPGYHVARLRGAILHNRLTPYSLIDFCDGRRMQEYAADLSQSMHARGKRAGMANLIFRPWLTFLKYYILRGGILDGRFGLVICYKTTIGVILKYSLLYGRELDEPGHHEDLTLAKTHEEIKT